MKYIITTIRKGDDIHGSNGYTPRTVTESDNIKEAIQLFEEACNSPFFSKELDTLALWDTEKHHFVSHMGKWYVRARTNQ